MESTETLSLKLPRSLAKALAQASRRQQISKSELVRQAIAVHLGGAERAVGAGPSLLDRAGDLAGCFVGGPKDLASNPRHLEGFGKL